MGEREDERERFARGRGNLSGHGYVRYLNDGGGFTAVTLTRLYALSVYGLLPVSRAVKRHSYFSIIFCSFSPSEKKKKTFGFLNHQRNENRNNNYLPIATHTGEVYKHDMWTQRRFSPTPLDRRKGELFPLLTVHRGLCWVAQRGVFLL